VLKDAQMTTTHEEATASRMQPTRFTAEGGIGGARVRRRIGLSLLSGAALIACDASGMSPSAEKPAPFATPPGTTKIATIELEKGGLISFSLFGNDAPQTVKNFEAKVAQGFYNGLKFHRVEDWVVQGGDPSGNGTGGGQMPSEFNKLEFKVGAVGIARGQDPRINNDSQFFIVKRDSPHLNGQYTNFGQVTEGLDLVVKIAIGDKIKKITVK
jgi:cyclophilin family peptidyl-prolyl cis-trans isomerase